MSGWRCFLSIFPFGFNDFRRSSTVRQFQQTKYPYACYFGVLFLCIGSTFRLAGWCDQAHHKNPEEQLNTVWTALR